MGRFCFNPFGGCIRQVAPFEFRNMIKGIIYTRVSSDEQVKGMSLEFQKEDCFKYAEGKSIKVVKLFEEKGESAKYADRPELINLLEHCRKNKDKISAL